MNEIITYVNKAFSHIPDSRRKTEIKQEITERLIDNANRLINNGKEYDDAINKAIVDFGDMNEIIDELREKTENAQSRGKSSLWFSIVGSMSLIVLVIFINIYYSNDVIWWVYPAFAVLWWPLCMYFFGSWRKYK